MDHERIATELAKTLRTVLEVEKSMTFGRTWNESRKAAWDVLERYQTLGPDVTSELLRVCKRVLQVITVERVALPLNLGVAIKDMQTIVQAVDQHALAVVGQRSRGR
jgi:hypothetical protein